LNWFENLNPVIQALIATTFTWGVTALGALMVCFFKKINPKVLSSILGFSAGVMIAASFWSLLAPAIDLSFELGYIAWILPAIGFIVGGLFVLLSDKFLDKVLKNKKSLKEADSLKRSILLVSAITIHNIPEGMSVGVAFGGIASGVPGMTVIGAIMLALGIGIQNFPEGAAVSLPLRNEGYSRFKSFMIGQASALVEPIAAVIGVVLVLTIRSILPFLLSFAAGAMIAVSARELLPESINEDKNLATIRINMWVCYNDDIRCCFRIKRIIKESIKILARENFLANIFYYDK
jgi:ZIP family zinc transporter